MKKALIVTLILISIGCQQVISQTAQDTTVYLITCGPGTETYSIYGHSALRISISSKKTDTVYNWGLFDFSTPNFAWKFAKGRLDYMLGSESLQSFLQIYFYEQRYVYSQKINLNPEETKLLIKLINENMMPENIRYKYDFFYDDCSTRIRDLLEESIGEKLLYPPAETEKTPTFREMVNKYQNSLPWLNFGIDLIMGSPGDKKASFRDRMFLPVDMKDGLSQAVVNRDGKMIPLLQNHEVILDFDPPIVQQKMITEPAFVFSILFIIIVTVSAFCKKRRVFHWLDLFIFSLFSVFAISMIFFNFFTDHNQMKWNLNITWLNPLCLVCLGSIILKKNWVLWFRLQTIISGAFLLFFNFLPQEFNIAIVPLICILFIRSSARADFEWNPFSLSHLQEHSV